MRKNSADIHEPAGPIFQATKGVRRCPACQSSFSFFAKKTHCFCCGLIFCTKCTLRKTNIPHMSYRKKVKVCDGCYLSLAIQYHKWAKVQSMPTTVLLDYLHQQKISTEHVTEKSDILALVQRNVITKEARALPLHTMHNNDDIEFEGPLRSHRSYSSPPAPQVWSPSEDEGEGEDDDVTNRNRSSTAAAEQIVHEGRLHNQIGYSPSNRSPSVDLSQYPAVRILSQDEEDYVDSLPVRQLKSILTRQECDSSDCIEKADLEAKVKMLMASNKWKGKPLYRPSNLRSSSSSPHILVHSSRSSSPACMRNNSTETSIRPQSPPPRQIEEIAIHERARAASEGSLVHGPVDSDLCKICYDREINCVFLECGHLVSCIECGRQVRDCPICRRFITRIVETYKS